MKRVVLSLVFTLLSTSAFGWNDRYEITADPNSNDIQMRKKYDYDPSNKYRGTIDDGGSIRMRNWNGDTIRGRISEDGYGKLRDQDGNEYRVKPRW